MHAYAEQLVRAATAAARTPSAAWRRSSRAATPRSTSRRSQGARGQGARGEPGLRRHLGRAPRPRAAGARDLRRGARRPARTRRSGSARTSCPTPPRCSRSTAPRARSRWPGVQTNVSVGLRYLDAWLERRRRGGDRQPHGGRGDGRDLARAAVAVDPARMPHERGRGRSPPELYERERDAVLASLPAEQHPHLGDAVACSTPSCWMRASRPS